MAIEFGKRKKKEYLVQNIRDIMANLNITDAVPFSAIMMRDAILRNGVVSELVNFLRTEISLIFVERSFFLLMFQMYGTKIYFRIIYFITVNIVSSMLL